MALLDNLFKDIAANFVDEGEEIDFSFDLKPESSSGPSDEMLDVMVDILDKRPFASPYGNRAMATVPAVSSARPRADLRVKRSPSTMRANSMATRMLILSICTTTLTTPTWMA